MAWSTASPSAPGLSPRRGWDVPVHGTDLAAVLESVHPRLAIVCSPPAAHHDAVITCLDAGVDVWCEKPAALSLREFDEMTAHEGVAGPYAVSYTHLTLPTNRE